MPAITLWQLDHRRDVVEKVDEHRQISQGQDQRECDRQMGNEVAVDPLPTDTKVRIV